jgi:hypothetical protein
MRHRLFHAIVVVGAATGCGASTETPSPAVDSAVTDTGASTDTGTSTETAVADSATADSAKVPDTGEDTCVDMGCGCMPCIK